MKIAQFIGPISWGDLTPDTMKEKGLGGRETALIQLSEAWAEAGHEVINFVPVERPRSYYKDKSGGVSHYVNHALCRPYLESLGSDVMVSWEEPRIFGNEEIRERVGLSVIEMQVAHLPTSKELDEAVDNYAVLSGWAGDFLCQQDPNISKDKIVVFPNGVDIERYSNKTADFGLREGPAKFYYSSSPDRGLNHILRIWPRIREEFPDSELHVAYGIEAWVDNVKWSHTMQCETALDVAEGVNQPGVVYHGKIGQKPLAAMQEASTALLYPCDTMSPTETGCITVVEAGASKSPAIITDADCLGSEFSETAAITPLPFNEDEYIGSIIDVVGDSEVYKRYQELGYHLACERHWPRIANQWLQWFEERLPETDARR